MCDPSTGVAMTIVKHTDRRTGSFFLGCACLGFLAGHGVDKTHILFWHWRDACYFGGTRKAAGGLLPVLPAGSSQVHLALMLPLTGECTISYTARMLVMCPLTAM